MLIRIQNVPTLASTSRPRVEETPVPVADQSPRDVLPTIAGAAIATESLSTLVTAVKAAGLVDTLNGDGTFTVFAPNNDAFAKIPEATLSGILADKELLKSVLLRHVVGSVIKAGDIPEGSSNVNTVGGEQITVTKGENGVIITSSAGTAKVIATDVTASNGVVHIVDTVF